MSNFEAALLAQRATLEPAQGYEWSTDYDLALRLLKGGALLGVVRYYIEGDGYKLFDPCRIRRDRLRGYQVAARGIGYFDAEDDAEFKTMCEKYEVRFLVPQCKAVERRIRHHAALRSKVSAVTRMVVGEDRYAAAPDACEDFLEENARFAFEALHQEIAALRKEVDDYDEKVRELLDERHDQDQVVATLRVLLGEVERLRQWEVDAESVSNDGTETVSNGKWLLCSSQHYTDLLAKVERLQSCLDSASGSDSKASAKNGELLAENERLRKALEFYADPQSYKYPEESDLPILQDDGAKARQALEGK